ncbi:unnamed protein product [Calypogeia fissa]
MGIGKLCIIWLLGWQLHCVLNGVEGQNLQVGFYELTCPMAETIVTNTVAQAFLNDNTITAALVRLLFHDCFVEGCDASILLLGPNSEQLAIPNLTVRGYGVITAAKSQLEAVCPGIVSCADIIALAARDAVGLLGGPAYQAETGRLDGLAPGIVTLPAPTDDVNTATPQFAAVGLTQEDMVTLLGAHSVGTSQCQFFSDRLYNYNNTLAPDPSMNTTYVLYLQNLCPQNGTGTTTIPLNSISEFVLDTSYYTGVLMGKGLLIIDQDIAAQTNTSVYVSNFAGASQTLNLTFSSTFVSTYNKMATIGLKTSVDGEIRTVCEIPN